jgi:4-amino-4-deoxy-L-arabinose transferase-like glycosyltransferase
MSRRSKGAPPRRDVAITVPWPPGRGARLLPWLLLILVLALVAAARWRLLGVPLERDEGEYAYAGQLLLQGVPPYQLAYNMKLPGTYAMYAGFLALFGETTGGVRLGLLLVNAAAIVLLFRLAQRLFGSTAAVVAAATYALLSMQREVLGLFAHATHMIVLWVLAGFLVLLTALELGRRRDWLASGLLLGIAFLMKQHAVFFVLAGAAVLVAAAWRSPERRSRAVGDALAFAGGAALPFVLTCLALSLIHI